MKHINKISVRIVAAVIIGFLVASSFTTIAYTIPPNEYHRGGVLYEDAISHPNDLLNNRQNSLVKFSTNFALASLVTFALISVVSIVYKNKT